MFITKKKHEKILEEKLVEQRNEFLSIYWAVSKVCDQIDERTKKYDNKQIGAYKCITAIKLYMHEIKSFLAKL